MNHWHIDRCYLLYPGLTRLLGRSLAVLLLLLTGACGSVASRDQTGSLAPSSTGEATQASPTDIPALPQITATRAEARTESDQTVVPLTPSPDRPLAVEPSPVLASPTPVVEEATAEPSPLPTADLLNQPEDINDCLEELRSDAETLKIFSNSVELFQESMEEKIAIGRSSVRDLASQANRCRQLVFPPGSTALQANLDEALAQIDEAVQQAERPLAKPVISSSDFGLVYVNTNSAIAKLEAILAFLNDGLQNLPTGDGMTILYHSADSSYSLRLDTGEQALVSARPLYGFTMNAYGVPYRIIVSKGTSRDYDPFAAIPFRLIEGGTLDIPFQVLMDESDLKPFLKGEPHALSGLILSRDERQIYFNVCSIAFIETTGFSETICSFYALDLSSHRISKIETMTIGPGWIAPDGQRAVVYTYNPERNPHDNERLSVSWYVYSVNKQSGMWQSERIIDANISELSWLPDGRFLYTSIANDPSQGIQLILANPDGTTARVLAENLGNTNFVLAPDGQRIAMVNPTSGALMVLTLDTLQLETVATLPGDARLVIWR